MNNVCICNSGWEGLGCFDKVEEVAPTSLNTPSVVEQDDVNFNGDVQASSTAVGSVVSNERRLPLRKDNNTRTVFVKEAWPDLDQDNPAIDNGAVAFDAGSLAITVADDFLAEEDSSNTEYEDSDAEHDKSQDFVDLYKDSIAIEWEEPAFYSVKYLPTYVSSLLPNTYDPSDVVDKHIIEKQFEYKSRVEQLPWFESMGSLVKECRDVPDVDCN